MTVPLTSALDRALTVQFAVAWAGEAGEEPRLSWWRTDMASEFGGQDLFQRLMPASWRWAVLQAARKAAQRADKAGRQRLPVADEAYTIFFQGYELDEALEERLQDLKRTFPEPERALPGLREVLGTEWDRTAFAAWVGAQEAPETTTTPTGRLLKGAAPANLETRFNRLLGALAPLGDTYPLPYFRRNL